MYIHSGLELRGASAWAHISIDASVMMLPDGQKLLNHLTVGLRSSLTIVWLPVAKPSNRNAKWRHKLIKKLLQLYAKVFKIRFVPTIYNATQLNVECFSCCFADIIFIITFFSFEKRVGGMSNGRGGENENCKHSNQ